MGTDMMCHIGFYNCNILDEMGGRIDELEQSINELRSEMGVEGSPSPSVPSKPKPESKSADDSA
jgi:heat shock factor-binding protein 1